MKNLSNALNASYSRHPDFYSDTPSLVLEQTLIDEFELQYNKISIRTRGTKRIHQIKKMNLLLQKISAQLSSQIQDDPFFQQFVTELFASITEYLHSENEYTSRLSQKRKQKFDLHSELLRKENCFFLDMNPVTTNSILELTEPLFNEFRDKARNGKRSRSDLSMNSGKIVEEVSRLVDQEFREKGVFEAVSNFIGIEYDHTGCSIELSVSGSNWWKNNMSQVEPPKTMYAHLDETKFAPKSILYLSEVSEKNGPTSYYPGLYRKFKNNALKDIVGRVIVNVGSNPDSPLHTYYQRAYHQPFSSQEFRWHFMRLPQEMRFNGHFGWDVLPGSEIESEMVDVEEKMLGGAGRYIVFDGAMLLHRGGLIEEGERKVLQIVFWPKLSTIERFKSKAKHLISKIEKQISS
jgi:hypothetical protein